jgi:hypothetical protein
MKIIQKILDFLNPMKVEEIQDKVGAILFGVVGVITTIATIAKSLGLAD